MAPAALQANPYANVGGGINVPSAFMRDGLSVQISPFFQSPALNDFKDLCLGGLSVKFSALGFVEVGGSIFNNTYIGTQSTADIQIGHSLPSYQRLSLALGIRNGTDKLHRQIGNLYQPAYTTFGSVRVFDDINSNSSYIMLSWRPVKALEGGLGWGMGEFKGIGPVNKTHKGTIAYGQAYLGHFGGRIEADGRSINMGLSFDPFKDSRVEVAWLAMENLRPAPTLAGQRPGVAARFSQTIYFGKRPQPVDYSALGSLADNPEGTLRVKFDLVESEPVATDWAASVPADIQPEAGGSLVMRFSKEELHGITADDISGVNVYTQAYEGGPFQVAVKSTGNGLPGGLRLHPPGNAFYITTVDRFGRESDPSNVLPLDASSAGRLVIPVVDPRQPSDVTRLFPGELKVLKATRGSKAVAVHLKCEHSPNQVQPSAYRLYYNGVCGPTYCGVLSQEHGGKQYFNVRMPATKGLSFYVKPLDEQGREGKASNPVIVNPKESTKH